MSKLPEGTTTVRRFRGGVRVTTIGGDGVRTVGVYSKEMALKFGVKLVLAAHANSVRLVKVYRTNADEKRMEGRAS